MTPQDIISARGITSVLHFTTSDGLLGMLGGTPPQLLPRAQLAETKHLEYIIKYNAPKRMDDGWLNYNSLSISRVNQYFFKYSFNNHHDAFWVVLEFSPDILTHQGVVFATTNNIYPEVVRKKSGEGLEGLFASRIKNCKMRTEWLSRPSDHPSNWPTDIQAEVLYPGALSFDYLTKIHVPDKASLQLISGQIAACHCDYDVQITPEHFSR